jgi:ribosomal protein L40E
MVYKASKEHSDCTDYVTEKTAAIDAVIEERDKLVNELNVHRNIKICPSCGADNEQNDIFCSKCGTKL